jgi:regulator of RNase E activity RraA
MTVQADHSQKLLSKLRNLDTCVVSDTLDSLNLPGATINLRPLWGSPKIVGCVITVQIVPRSDTKPSEHLNTAAIESGGSNDVIVVANGGRTDVSCWGDILANAAVQKGLNGVVIDGACRDIDACSEIKFPVFGKAVVSISARGRVVQHSYNEPIMMAGVRVEPGDFLIADGSGTVFIPQGRAKEVIEIATRLSRKQELMVEAVKSGRSVMDVMHDREFDKVLKTEV